MEEEMTRTVEEINGKRYEVRPMPDKGSRCDLCAFKSNCAEVDYPCAEWISNVYFVELEEKE